jgi:hypothetical protein
LGVAFLTKRLLDRAVSIMSPIILDAEAVQVSAELARRGFSAHARVHVLVEVAPGGEFPMAEKHA